MPEDRRLLGDPEIDEHDATALVEQDVLGLQVAVDDGRILGVQIAQDHAELAHPRQERRERDAPALAVALARECAAAAELKRQIHHPAGREAIDDVRDRRVLETTQERRFVLVEEQLRDLLECSPFPVQTQIVHEVGGAEAALTQDRSDPVAVLDGIAGGPQPAEHAPDRAIGGDVEVRQLEAAARAPVVRG